MHLIYIDDSYEKPYCTFSAIAIPASRWKAIFAEILAWRRKLKVSDKIRVTREFHATEFVAGRGNLGPQVVSKWRRCRILDEGLDLLNQQSGLNIFNVCLSNNKQEWAFERLLNRVNRTMEEWDSHALLICDEGKEEEYIRLVRKMGVYNPISSRFGTWLDTGKTHKNIPLDRVLEDPFFKSSSKSFFVQMSDFCAYALLRREKHLPSKNRYGLHKSFDRINNVVVRAANPEDPMGIIKLKARP